MSTSDGFLVGSHGFLPLEIVSFVRNIDSEEEDMWRGREC